ncbi:glycosyltransferase [Roseobacter sinensis]|uniref:Glycosyltransferase n=1 Tax=Roseobacter sinensis TaxID=2931391 RepID=A0ABT3BIK8_9RHOB|nr:glycosyltransferase [Roseobacter sp. WL0113]MCV3273402.1 glycosyltransferase [Roseobacter sp. WL0113]
MTRLRNQPAGSVILVASAGQDSIARTLECLRHQTIADRLEIVLAARPDEVSGLKTTDPEGFFGVEVVPADFTTSAIARSAAIRKASADVVLFVEDHSFPTRADWAERLVAAHQAGHVAVGPSMKNANPRTPTSWANLVIEYGQWMNVTAAGQVDQLPGHNSSYKRAALTQYGDDLAEMLEAEWVLHNELRAQGETLWIDPEISTAHLNFSRFGSAMKLHFLEGRMFAASRSAHWGRGRRAAYALAFPLIFVVRFVRIARQLLASEEARSYFLRTVPSCVVFLLLSAMGEGMGYAFSDGGQRAQLGQLEYDRWKFIQTGEQDLTIDYV